MTTKITRTADSNGIATLTIDVPDRPMNVIDLDFMTELDGHIDAIERDDAITGVIVASAKGSFAAGGDLHFLVRAFDAGLSAQELYDVTRQFTGVFRRLESCGKPFVAALNGTAMGGGLELALACHYRVAAADPKAQIGLPEVKLGLLPGAGGTQRLPRLIGVQPALELMTQGTSVDPQKALEMGIVDAVVANDQLLATAKAWLLDEGDPIQPWDKKGFRVPGGNGAMSPKVMQAFMAGNALVAKNTQHNYPAPISIMSCVFEGTIVPIDAGLRIESRYFTRLLQSPVYRNMIRTLFINKGAADKLVRRPRGIPESRVTKLGMLGAGMMGAGIAYVAARAGIEVVLIDQTIEAAERGKDYSRGLLQKRVERGRSTPEKAEVLLNLIKPSTDYNDLDGADLVVEAVFESRDIKADVTQKSEAVIPRHAVFASNTSTLPITGLAEASSRPNQFIGLHFFSPVDKMPLLEIILGEQTSDETLAKSLDFCRQIRKTPIVVRDSRGFYTSRVFFTYVNEGMELLKDGVPAALIENLGKQAGMAVGPLAVADEVTLDLAHKVHRQTQADLGDAYEPRSATDVVERFVNELDRRGKRFGKGFYDYPEGAKKRLWPGLAAQFPAAADIPEHDVIKKRLLYVQALETVRCLDEGVITDVADADIGAIFGWGFPPYTGGTLSLIDTVGLDVFVEECDRLAETLGSRFAVPASLRQRAERGENYYPAEETRETRSAA